MARGPNTTTLGKGHSRSSSPGGRSGGTSRLWQWLAPALGHKLQESQSQPEHVRRQTKGGKCLMGRGRQRCLPTCHRHGKAQTRAAPAQGLARAPLRDAHRMLAAHSHGTLAAHSYLGAGHPCPSTGTAPDCSPLLSPTPCRGQEPGIALGKPRQRALAVIPPLPRACPTRPLCHGGSHTALHPVLSQPGGLRSGTLPWAGARRFPPALGSGRQQPCACCGCLLPSQ